MATSRPIWDESFIAGEDLSSSQFCAVKLSAANTVVLCGVGEQAVGILQNAPTSGQAATVRVLGSSLMKANGPFAFGDVLAVVAATGKVDTASAASHNFAVGQAWAASGAANDLVECLVWTRLVEQTELTYRVPLRVSVAGDITSNIAATLIDVAHGAGRIVRAGMVLGNTGADGTDALSAELDVLVDGTTVFSTKPALAKTAADGASTLTAGTGVTVGVVNAAADDVAANSKVTYTLTLTRTTPEDEVADLFVVVDVEYTVTL